MNFLNRLRKLLSGSQDRPAPPPAPVPAPPPTPITAASVPVPNELVISQFMDGEAVLVDSAGGRVKVLNEAGAAIWGLVDGERSAAQIAAAISEQYRIPREQTEADTLAFLAELRHKGLLTLR